MLFPSQRKLSLIRIYWPHGGILILSMETSRMTTIDFNEYARELALKKWPSSNGSFDARH